MESDSIDLTSYFTFLDLNEYLKTLPKPTFETLEKIVEKHATKFFYQNIDLQIKFTSGLPIVKEDLLLSTIQKKLIQDKRGGMCYEINSLMEAALSAVGFKVHFISGYIAPYIPERETSHLALLVELDEKSYLVDPGFGFNNIRVPLNLNFGGNTETLGLEYEKYQIRVESNHYLVNLFVDDKVLGLFYFMKEGPSPKLSKKEQVISEYIAFMTSSQEFRVRDWALYLGRATPDGRFGYWYNKKEKSGFAFKQANNNTENHKITFQDFKSFQEKVKEMFAIEFPADLQNISIKPRL